MQPTEIQAFGQQLLYWHRQCGRDLPWRFERDPYRIWVSEIMLQQTRAETVVGYYHRFLRAFPDVFSLAEAPEQEVLKQWEGLGYYSRARNLKRAAQQIVLECGGRFPDTAAQLKKLPGIGDYTAGAVASIAFDRREAALDGNGVRVLSRVAGVRESVGLPSVKRRLREIAQSLVPEERPGEYNQALMGLGALLCLPRNPKCEACPVSRLCDAYRVGDQEQLPVLPPKLVKQQERRGVALVFSGDRVLLRRRPEEGLLAGLWELPNFLDAVEPEPVAECLKELGLEVRFEERLGAAKHVFTHKVWRMRGLRFSARPGQALEEGYRFVTAQEMRALPMPVAVAVYRGWALEWLERGGDRP